LAVAGLVASGSVHAVDFTLGFDSAPERIHGAPGQVSTFELHATLSTEKNPAAEGAQGWALSLEVDGGEFAAVDLSGLAVDTLFDEDDNSTTPLTEVPLDLGQAEFSVAALASWNGDRSPPYGAAVSAVVLDLQTERALLPEGSERIARLTVAATIPDGSECAPVTIRFVDGCCPGYGEPVANTVSWQGKVERPVLGSATILLCPGALFRRGDSDASGQVDITDPIYTLNNLFGGGSPPSCRDAADANDDGRIDISDPVSTLEILFTRVEPFIPPPGPYRCGVDPTADPLPCADYSC
jgi:hypothetical protein